MEFKYLVAQEKIEQLQTELKEGSKNSSRSSDNATQTDSTKMNDFQSQTNAQLQNNPMITQTPTETTQQIPVQTDDAGGTESKKRKLSSISESTSTTTEQSTVDDSILNSEVYKIYQQNTDPKEAMKQMKALKNCLLFEEAKTPLPSDIELKNIFDAALRELWKFSSSDFIAIKRFIRGDTKEE